MLRSRPARALLQVLLLALVCIALWLGMDALLSELAEHDAQVAYTVLRLSVLGALPLALVILVMVLRRRRWVALLLLAFAVAAPPLGAYLLPPIVGESATVRNECVVLLHGLARTELSMLRLQALLESRGYRTRNLPYPSTEQPVEASALVVGAGVDGCRAQGTKRIHFVTHSLGGILVRQYLRTRTIEGLGRIVMLAPPNQGSEVVDRYGNRAWFRALNGPAGQQLGTRGLPPKLRPIAAEIGIIAGTRSSDPWFSAVLPGPDDGKVSTRSARLTEMRDYLLVPHGHTFMMNSPEVGEQVLSFLAQGQFKR